MLKMRKAGVLLICLLSMVVAVASVASANEGGLEVEGGAYIGTFDKYLWRGFDLSGGEPVAQGGVDLSAAGFTLSFWSNMQLKNDTAEGYSAGELNETDVIIDYSFDFCDMAWGSVGNIFYALSDAEDTNEAYFAAGLNTILSPSLTVYWDWDKAEEDGLFYTLAVGHDFDVTDVISVSLSASAGYNQENYSVDESYSDWHNAEFGLTADYALTAQTYLSSSFIYSTPMSSDAKNIAEIDDEVALGLTVGFNF